jgi:hypothetical protein
MDVALARLLCMHALIVRPRLALAAWRPSVKPRSCGPRHAPKPWSLPPWLRALARAASLFSARYSHPLHLHRPAVKAHVLGKGSCHGRYHTDRHPGVWL